MTLASLFIVMDFGQDEDVILHWQKSIGPGKASIGFSREIFAAVLIRHLDTPSKTNGLDGTCPQSLELLQGGRLIREQIQARLHVFADLNATIVDSIINPVRRNVKSLGKLGQGERACHAARMGLMTDQELPMFEAKPPDGAG
jgi:hypothetical protein